jgi:hypothetical protein
MVDFAIMLDSFQAGTGIRGFVEEASDYRLGRQNLAVMVEWSCHLAIHHVRSYYMDRVCPSAGVFGAPVCPPAQPTATET